MSSHFPRRIALALGAFALVIAGTAARADKAPAPITAPAPVPADPRTVPGQPAPKGRPEGQRATATVDDSSAAAHEMLTFTRSDYGGLDNYPMIAGARYYITYRIPGPDGATVRTWTESHIVWFHDRPRVRIDNASDSTIVVVTGDSTFVRRDGAWSADSAVVAESRTQAMDAYWFLHLPWNLLNHALKRRLDPPWVKDGPLSVRVEYGPGQDRPAGTRLWVRFDPPTYAIRNLRWFDPRSNSWFMLELERDQTRYEWTWAERRTLRASDSEGKAGPVILEAQIEDMQLENTMPTEVLAPPGGTAVVLH